MVMPTQELELRETTEAGSLMTQLQVISLDPCQKGDPTAFWLTSPDSKYVVPAGDNPYGVAQSTDPNFEAPSSWRTSLGLDMLLDSGWDLTLEYNLDQVRQAVFFTDLGLERREAP